MKSRQLGNNGFNVSEVGLGCWQLGGDWGKSITKTEAFNIMEEAVKQGVSIFDTADVYGNGQSEKVIGEFLKKYNSDIKIATKFGRSSDVFPQNYTEKALRNCVNGSLKRLKVDYLDLLQLHCVPTSIIKEGTIFNWLRKLKSEGLIKEFGASVETVEEGFICIEQEGIRSIQVIFNMFRQKLIDELLPQCKEKGVGVIVRLPLASGLLTGKFTKNTKFLDNDHRNYNSNGDAFNVGETFAGIPFEKGVFLAQKIEELFLPNDLTMVQFALRWILDNNEVSCIIPGASSQSQVRQNASISTMDSLPKQTHKLLSEFYNNEIKQNIRGPY